jgi:WD40 repeat protein
MTTTTPACVLDHGPYLPYSPPEAGYCRQARIVRLKVAWIVTLFAVAGALAQPASAPAREPRNGENEGGAPKLVARLRHAQPVFDLTFTADGKQIITGCYHRHNSRDARGIHVWDIATGKTTYTFTAHDNSVFSLAWAPDRRTLVSSGAHGGPLRFWDPATRKELTPFQQPPVGKTSVAWSPDGKTLATVTKDEVHLWDFATGKELRKFGYTGVCTIAFAPNGKYLASVGGLDMSVHLWDVHSGAEVRTFSHAADAEIGNFIHIAFSPDGKTLAGAGNSDRLQLWEVATGKERLAIMGPNPSQVQFAPDGRLLVGTGWNRTPRLYDVATGKRLWVGEKHADHIQCAGFSPDGRLLATGDEAGLVQVWDVSRVYGLVRPKTSELSAEECGRHWQQLAGDDGPAAYRALATLSVAPAQSVPYLKERLKPVSLVKLPAQDELDGMVRDLDSDTFAVRQRASRSLEGLVPAVIPYLRRAAQGKISLEARSRIEMIVRRYEQRELTEEELRELRAVEVLEHIGTPEARQLLDGLAKGESTTRLTAEARESLDRLERRARK